MKEETKELVEFIKDCVFRYQTELKRGEVDVEITDREKENKTCDKAINFLDSLPKIESHLCRGGYIQDKNGTPCCDGDQIINPNLLDGVKELGTLYWSKSDCCFYFKKEDKCHSLAVGYNGFEKVEE